MGSYGTVGYADSYAGGYSGGYVGGAYAGATMPSQGQSSAYGAQNAPQIQNAESMIAYPSSYYAASRGSALQQQESMIAFGPGARPVDGGKTRIKMYKSRRKKNCCY